jgi:hypothetical protein
MWLFIGFGGFAIRLVFIVIQVHLLRLVLIFVVAVPRCGIFLFAHVFVVVRFEVALFGVCFNSAPVGTTRWSTMGRSIRLF